MYFAILGLLLLLEIDLSKAGQICASCSGVKDKASCQHFVTCDQSEKCYVRHYRTESGSDLIDLGYMTAVVCPLIVPAAIGRRGEGHHVMCEACCNTIMCNQLVSCEFFQNQEPKYPRDCSELNLRKRLNGTYTIYPDSVGHSPVSTYCIFDFNDMAWTVIQRRIDGSVDFYRNWTDYVTGFGATDGEYWLGLDNIHALTSIPNYELQVVMMDFQNVTKHALYASFHVDSASKNYRLTVYGYSGTAGDSLDYHSGVMFSTFDNDNDGDDDGSCAKSYHGAWWFNSCHNSNLNGKYVYGNHSSNGEGVEWDTFHHHISLKSTIMMIRKP